jgi:hypothetical protein
LPPAASFAQIWAFLQPVYNGAMTEPENPPTARLSPAGWITIAILLGLLGWAIWYAIRGWASMGTVHMSTLGWVFLTAGIVVTFLLGAGLMGLVFYSSRHDMDR